MAIYLALDYSTLDEIRHLKTQLGDLEEGVNLKVGHQAIHSIGGPVLMDYFKSEWNRPVMYDAKFVDIADTIKKAVIAVAKLGAISVTVYSQQPEKTLSELSAMVRKTFNTYIELWGVALLSDTEDQTKWNLWDGLTNIRQAKFNGAVIPAWMLQQAQSCSTKLIVTGVRPVWAAQDCHHHSVPPSTAIKNGAKHMVIGRPITHPPIEIGSPRDALQLILEELAGHNSPA